ITVQEGMGSLT
nr:immunoglobulin heavy chain junction region [Mus musculus]